MKTIGLLGAAGICLMAVGYASDTPPIPRMSSVCPPGYARHGAYCVPVADDPKPAIPRESSVCPPGYYRYGAYCVQNVGK